MDTKSEHYNGDVLTSCTIPGTAMLAKRRQMTAQQAYHAGKLGRADLHMHSTYSDGTATIQQVLQYAQQQTNLDVIALTDHDVIDGALRAHDLWSKGQYRFDFIVGEEISTRSGHLLALFIEKRIQPGLSMEESIDLIHAQGGLAIVAHPLNQIFRHSCPRYVLDRIKASESVWLDGIETWNASFCGMPSSFQTVTFFPWSFSASARPSWEPTQSPSGRTWPTMQKVLCWLISSRMRSMILG